MKKSKNIRSDKVKKTKPFAVLVEVPSEVIDRLSNNEIKIDKDGLPVYRTSYLKAILSDPDDDTNESTKYWLERLYEIVKPYRFFKVI